MTTPIIPRIMFKTVYPAQPWDGRPTLIGNEVEPEVRINLRTLTVSGFFGGFPAIPATSSMDATRYTSVPFTVQLTDAERPAILMLLSASFSRAAQAGVAGMDLSSTLRIDPV